LVSPPGDSTPSSNSFLRKRSMSSL